MDYRTNIWHQRLVAILGSRNLYLRTVYAHIANYTVARGAWCGTQRELAAQLELPTATVNDQVDKLKTMGLVLQNGDSFVATKLPNPPAVRENTPAVQANPSSVQMRTGAVQENPSAVQIPTPINEIKTMEINEKNARANMRDANPETQCSFERLEYLYKKRAGDYQMADEVRRTARNLWDTYPLWKRLRLFEELNKPTGWFRPRLDWTLQNFNPQPTNLNESAEGGEMLRTGQAKIARYNGSYGVYSLKDIDDFGLVEAPKAKK